MIRAILFNAFFWPGFVGYLAIMYPFTYFANQKQVCRFVYRKVTRWMLFCLRVFSGIKHEVVGIDKLKKQLEHGPVIIGCNHQSAWETFVFSLFFEELTVVAKKELFKLPIAGIYFDRLKCIPVDRTSVVSAIKSLIKHGKIALENRQSIVIFPNGTRGLSSEKAEYKSGIFALYKTLGIPVVPCYVNSGEFWPRRAFKKKKGTIILEFKDVILPGLDKESFMSTFEERQAI